MYVILLTQLLLFVYKETLISFFTFNFKPQTLSLTYTFLKSTKITNKRLPAL